MYVRLTRKLADSLDGIDVSRVMVGDVIELADAEAAMLISEGWAERTADEAAKNLPRTSDSKQRTG